MCACKIFSLWSKIFSQSMKSFQISLQKPGAVCCGPQLSCGSGLLKLPDFVLGFFFYFLGSCNLFTQAHRKLGSLPVSWEALFGNYLEQQLQLPKEVHAGSPTTEQKDLWSHFWCPYSKSPKGLALPGQADGPWQMTEQNLCSALQGFPFFPFQLSCLLLLSAFPSLPVTLGQMRISAAQLPCILDCWNGLLCLMVLCVLPKKCYLCAGWEKNWQCLSRKLLPQRHSPQRNILGETSHPSSPLVWCCFHWAEYEYEAEYLPVELQTLRSGGGNNEL